MTLNHDLLKVGALKGINIILKFILSILTVQVFGIEGRGEYFKVIQLTGVISFLFGFSVHDYFIYNQNGKRNKEILELSLILSFGLVLLSTIALYYFKEFWILYIGLFFSFWGEYYYFSYEKSRRRYNTISVYIVIKNLIYIIYLYSLRPSLHDAFFSYMLLSVSSFLIMYVFTNTWPCIRVKFADLRKLFTYSKYVHVNNVLNDFENKIDLLLIIYLLNTEDLGFYSIVVILVQSVNNIVNILIQVVSPKFNKLSPMIRRFYWNILIYLAVASSLFWLFFGNSILSQFYGINVPHVRVVLIILAIAMIPEILSKFLVLRYKYAKLDKSVLLRYSIICVVCNISLNIILTPALGLYGVAIASLCSYSLRFTLILRSLVYLGFTPEYRIMNLEELFLIVRK